nr:integrase, catalytic region, zinc finger, CCHC-type, peptidase aspartic, catalytic [Tanacetum cinerariifolium]
RGAGYDNQRLGNVAGARETVGSTVVSNDNNYNVFAIESEHPKQSKYVHDIYPIEQDEHNVIIDSLDMSYDREQTDQNDDDDDLANEHELLVSLIEKIKCEIDDSRNRNKFLETSNKVLVDKLKGEIEDFKTKNKSLESSNNRCKEANNKLTKTNKLMYKDIKKFQGELDRHNDVEYASKVEIDYEVTSLQCDYLEMLEKYECLEKELSKSKMMSKSFEALQKHAINLEIDLQQCQKKIKNDKSFKENQSKEFPKEHEQYFEIQDLKAQLQDKGILTSDLKKLIEKLKGKSVDTKFEKSSVIRQPNAFKSQRPSILGKLTIFSDSLERKDFSKSKSITKNNVSNDFSKPVTAQILPPNKKSILKNTNVLAPGMTKMPIDVPISNREPKRTVKQSVAKPLRKTVASESTNQKPRNTTRKLYEHLVEIVLFIINSGCSKHMTGNLKLLINFMEKFIGAVKFGNDQIAPILGYGDLVQGAITIKRVYYVEGLNHNLFSVGQFCDADLEVAFRKSTCYIHDLKGNDVLTGSRGTDLYSITLKDTSSPNPICLMAKATSSQAWLWH